ncbi:hypothetical protein AVP43_00144 [Geobacillus stearothermophilus]|uniref:DUF3986 family protein n=1 Tax=Geobacillus sp. DSP4a TaxID=2508873 RepID=UPI00067E4888|nr:hypothetical protein IB49_14695 [Geobacillus sp. LC300]KZE97880.1 hypothetical protein AVP43_00144 [Geobacillus stearothermophilus]NNV00844.1 DUF3986 family protein [Geobacillus sp. DSP4a]QOR85050.1 DUF3986 family protein [Geobacillus stearothermophilus]
MKFDPNQHLHLGYYENNVDLEAVAYKIQNENKWVVFLDNEQDTTLVKKILDKYDFHEKYGYKIFTVDADDLSYEVGSKLFEEWLKANNITVDEHFSLQ